MESVAQIARHYREELYPCYQQFAQRLRDLLRELLRDNTIAYEKIVARTKAVDSFLEKIERKAYTHPFSQIKDFAGIRIITYYSDDVQKIKELINKTFEVDSIHSGDKLEHLHPGEFGYRSVHLVVSLPESRLEMDEWKRFNGLVAEIQIRSILQHAWANLSHKISYKTQAQAPPQLQRRLFRLSALIELADEEFRALRDMAQGITTSYRNEVQQGDLELPLNLDSLREFMEQKKDILKRWEQFGVQAGMEPFPRLFSKFHALSLESLLLTLQTVGIHTLAEFTQTFQALEQAEPALQQFVAAIHAKGGTVHAVPVDVLIFLISIVKARLIPVDFDWGGIYEPFLVETLHDIVRSQL